MVPFLFFCRYAFTDPRIRTFTTIKKKPVSYNRTFVITFMQSTVNYSFASKSVFFFGISFSIFYTEHGFQTLTVPNIPNEPDVKLYTPLKKLSCDPYAGNLYLLYVKRKKSSINILTSSSSVFWEILS